MKNFILSMVLVLCLCACKRTHTEKTKTKTEAKTETKIFKTDTSAVNVSRKTKTDSTFTPPTVVKEFVFIRDKRGEKAIVDSLTALYDTEMRKQGYKVDSMARENYILTTQKIVNGKVCLDRDTTVRIEEKAYYGEMGIRSGTFYVKININPVTNSKTTEEDVKINDNKKSVETADTVTHTAIKVDDKTKTTWLNFWWLYVIAAFAGLAGGWVLRGKLRLPFLPKI